MRTPTVTEIVIALEPVTRDDFADSLPSACELEPPAGGPGHRVAPAMGEAGRRADRR
jgi:hypothetical protein